EELVLCFRRWLARHAPPVHVVCEDARLAHLTADQDALGAAQRDDRFAPAAVADHRQPLPFRFLPCVAHAPSCFFARQQRAVTAANAPQRRCNPPSISCLVESVARCKPRLAGRIGCTQPAPGCVSHTSTAEAALSINGK